MLGRLEMGLTEEAAARVTGQQPENKTATWAARYLTGLILLQPLPTNEGILKPFTEDLFIPVYFKLIKTEKPVRSGRNHMWSVQ